MQRDPRQPECSICGEPMDGNDFSRTAVCEECGESAEDARDRFESDNWREFNGRSYDGEAA